MTTRRFAPAQARCSRNRPSAAAAIVNRYASAVERGGDAARGQEVFARTCAACHHLGGGTAADVGPDLATIRHRPPLSLLVDILSPSQSIAQGYETYLVRAARRPDRGRNAGVADRRRDHAASGREDGHDPAPRHPAPDGRDAQSTMPSDARQGDPAGGDGRPPRLPDQTMKITLCAAAARRPARVSLAARRAEQTKRPPLVGIDHVAFRASNAAAARAFYGELLGLAAGRRSASPDRHDQRAAARLRRAGSASRHRRAAPSHRAGHARSATAWRRICASGA